LKGAVRYFSRFATSRGVGERKFRNGVVGHRYGSVSVFKTNPIYRGEGRGEKQEGIKKVEKQLERAHNLGIANGKKIKGDTGCAQIGSSSCVSF